jgi:hypothetical protein
MLVLTQQLQISKKRIVTYLHQVAIRHPHQSSSKALYSSNMLPNTIKIKH